MLKISIIAACLGVISAYPYPVPVTQEQLAQYVAAQQTLGVAGDDGKAQSVSILPRARQAYGIPQHLYKQAPADDAQEAAQQHQHQQQRAIAYVAQPNAYPSAYSNPASNAYSQQPAYSSSAQSISAYYQQSRQPQVQLDQSQLQALKKLRPAGATPSPETPEEDFDLQLSNDKWRARHGYVVTPEEPNPQYQFSFDVKDDEYTNYHNRKEQREGDKISGSYSVVDSDGYIRTVTYTADPLQGFKAEVSRQPTDIKVKFPSPPTPVPQQYQQVDAHQGQSAHTLLARKQQTQQYLEAASPIDSASQQYSFRPQPAYSAVPQGLSPQAYAHPAPQKAVIPVGLGAYTGPHRLSPPQKPVKATAIGFASQTSTANPILYQAYQQ